MILTHENADSWAAFLSKANSVHHAYQGEILSRLEH
jgi:hypothetical protein